MTVVIVGEIEGMVGEEKGEAVGGNCCAQ